MENRTVNMEKMRRVVVSVSVCEVCGMFLSFINP